MTCIHKKVVVIRSDQYIRQIGIRRREYRCAHCQEKLPTTFEGTHDDLYAMFAPQIRKQLLNEVKQKVEELT